MEATGYFSTGPVTEPIVKLSGRKLFYMRPQGAPRSKQFPPRLCKTSLLMLRKAKVTVCSEIHTKNINAVWAPCRICEL